MTGRVLKRTVLGSLTAGLLIGLVAVGTSFGQPRRPDAAPAPRGPGDRFEVLALTSAQKSQMRALRSEQMKGAAQIRADVAVARIELEDLLQTKSPGERAVTQALAKLQAAEAKALEHRVAGRLAMQEILTDEQFEKFREKGPGRMGHGPKGPQGPSGVRPGREHRF